MFFATSTHVLSCMRNGSEEPKSLPKKLTEDISEDAKSAEVQKSPPPTYLTPHVPHPRLLSARQNRMRANQSGASDVHSYDSILETPAPAYDMGHINPSAGLPTLSLSVEYKEGEEEGWMGFPGMMTPTGGSGEDSESALGAAARENLTETFARRKPIRELTPHLVEELEGEGGGFTLTVFRNNKQVCLFGWLVGSLVHGLVGWLGTSLFFGWWWSSAQGGLTHYLNAATNPGLGLGKLPY